ncbi:hypothetical protein ACFLYJ_00630 [Candidatus Cloacimonadota bacterium]
MGRLVFSMLMLMFVLFTIISITTRERSEDIPVEVSQNMAEIHAGALSEEALNFGIKRLNEGSIDFVNGESVLRFNNFNVMNGIIDSIQFTQITLDSILIRTHASYQVNSEVIHRRSSALISLVPANIQSAVSANGEVVLKGNAAVVGDIDEYADPPLDFEDIFGVTKGYIESIANNTYMDPPNNISPCNNVTWVNFSDPSNSMKVTTTAWSGSGLMIINGDASFSGGSFRGILWVTGELYIAGNLQIEGALYVEGGTEISATVIAGSPVIDFSVTAISEFLSTATFPTDMQYNIVSIFDESD